MMILMRAWVNCTMPTIGTLDRIIEVAGRLKEHQLKANPELAAAYKEMSA
jgi:hypothetical protein